MRVWLDDIRDPVDWGHFGWKWAKTAREAIDLLRTGKVTAISLDHDLCIQSTIGIPAIAPTGLDVILWMEMNNVWPERVACHSANPYGKSCIEAVMKRNGKPPINLIG